MPYRGATFKLPQVGGWNCNGNLDQVPIDAMVDVNNVNTHNGGREPRGGCEAINSAITGTPKIMGIYQFIREDGSLTGYYVVDEAGDNIGDEYGNKLISESTDIVTCTSDGKIQQNYSTELKTGLALNKYCYFETFYNELYISNGEDTPQVWGSSRAYTWDMGTPIKCTAALAGLGAGNVNAGTHYYKVTYVTASGESTPGVISDVVTTTAGDGQVALSAIPIGAEGTTSRKIYRTKAGGTTYYLLTTLANNTTTIYADNTADADITVAAPTTNLAFLPSDWVTYKPKYFIKHGRGVSKRLWAFGVEGYPNYLYASKNGQADFSDANVTKIKIMCDEITGAVEFGGNLIVFSREKTFLIDDTALTVANWGYQAAVWEGGAAHQRLIVKTPTDVMVMSEDGNIVSIMASQQYGDFQIASLTKPIYLNEWIKNNLDLLLIDEFFAVYDPAFRCIKIFCVSTGSTIPDMCLVYFIDKGVMNGWTKHTFALDFLCGTLVRESQAVWKIYVGDNVGVAYKLESTSLLDAGVIYNSNWKMPPLPFENPRSRKRYDKLWYIMKPLGTEVLNATISIDNRDLTAKTITMTEAEDILQNFGTSIGAIGKRIEVNTSSTDGKNYFVSSMMIDVTELGSGG